MNWYRKAAVRGFAPAQHNLGASYESGTGVTKDLSEAVNWYRKAADQGVCPGPKPARVLLRQGERGRE